MNMFAYLRSLGGKLFRRTQIAGEMDEELREHIALRTADLERTGVNRAEAERRARIEFGGVTRFREESHEAMGGNFIETLAGDMRFALRVLWKSPGFTVTAVLTLAMGIGANAVVFSVMNGLILRPLNVPEPKSLYEIERAGVNDGSQSYPDLEDLRSRNRSFDDLAGFNIPQVGFDTGDGSSQVWGVQATGNYFDVLGIHPYLGRFFHASDEHGPNSAPYVVLGYAYWHTHFNDDRGVLGRVVEINRHPFTIIGVAPESFRGTLVIYSPNFFVPMVNQEQIEGTSYLSDRGTRDVLMMIGHLSPGVTPAQAIADLNSVGSWLEKTYPRDDRQMSFALSRPNLFGSEGEPVHAFLAGLMLLAGLILLAACANLGSLFAARAMDRSKEIALRLALGSSRKRILRTLLTESVLVSIVGGAAGMWAGSALLHWLAVYQPFGNFPLHMPVSPDTTVYAVTLAITLASGFLFGAVSIRQVLRTSPYEVVKTGSAIQPGRGITARNVLLAVQISLCAVLVTSSIVAVRGLVRALHDHFGFDPERSTLVNADLHTAGYRGDRAMAMQRRMIDAVAAIPGVESVGLTDVLLLNDVNASNVFSDHAPDLKASNAAATVYMYHVSPDYLRAEGTALIAGRSFTWDDDRDSPRVAVVNREFARRVFGSEAGAAGGHYKMADGTRVEVVGIAEDGKYSTLTEHPHPAMFLPIAQWPSNSAWIVVRSGRNLDTLGAAIRNALHRLDPGLPAQVEDRYSEMVTVLLGPRLAAQTLGVLGGMGAILSISGIFGVAAYTVSKRLRELGIRIALGAQRVEVLKAALGPAFRLLAIGSAAGLILGLLAAKVLASIVYEATPRDPLVIASVVLAMAVLGLIATWLPAQRALSVDPLILLREE